jgi:hypothetical protein
MPSAMTMSVVTVPAMPMPAMTAGRCRGSHYKSNSQCKDTCFHDDTCLFQALIFYNQPPVKIAGVAPL